ncbi:MAG: hypothetical protein KGS61_08715 [Verrucomicrobia bacterium]|nr:hypothetical protein [Verrucomicrobiota bacterium]
MLLDPRQALERTCFQTGHPFSERSDLRSDVAIVYGIDPQLPDRIATWRAHGYRIHVMTGVSWGHYQDYLYGRFDGTNHQDEAQTDRTGRKVSHGGDVYYMCPGQNYGKFLCVGVQRALDAGAQAIHLEEPEFWVRSGYSAGFKREWKGFYGDDWVPPHNSVDAQWRASKLKYFLYRRALQQVFDFVQAYNRQHGRQVRCYVPTHSLLNYAHWRIVSPESSLARLDGCDGYIAQVWTGTARTPNLYRGRLAERTFETAFLEYGAMQNLVRSTGRQVWYLNDPVEDNPNHDWDDYRRNWESTLTASLLQPAVWRYEVMPWPERVFSGRYPSRTQPGRREPIPPQYATELQTVINTLNDMNQAPVRWDCGTERVGVMVSDSMMFERGEPDPGDAHLSDFYGLALPLLKQGVPVEPVQLENLTIPGCLDRYDLILLSYRGMKPLSPDVHAPLVRWVKAGGALVFVDDDGDPYNAVREWWNRGPNHYSTPREHLFDLLGLARGAKPGRYAVGRGVVDFRAFDPAQLAREPDGPDRLLRAVRAAIRGTRTRWRETNYLLLRRGCYVIAAGLTEGADAPPRILTGRFVNLFDPQLRVQTRIELTPGDRKLLLDLDRLRGSRTQVLAAACKALPLPSPSRQFRCVVEGVAQTPGGVLLRIPARPRQVTLQGAAVQDRQYEAKPGLLWLRFANEARPRELRVTF